jgi:catechol 2,3-dioxygenase-like lactoylglutathione lyase family enzyme
MPNLGFNHIDLATRDMAATRRFYEDILGFPVVRGDIMEIEDVGQIQHLFFDIGGGQLIAFMSGEDATNFPDGYDTGINRGLGLPDGVYHFAFEAGSPEQLAQTKTRLEGAGIKVRGIVDHEGWCQSIYFKDPNGLQLEYCCLTRTFDADDALPQVRFRIDKQGVKRPAEVDTA